MDKKAQLKRKKEKLQQIQREIEQVSTQADLLKTDVLAKRLQTQKSDND